jgi:hypothetical protein
MQVEGASKSLIQYFCRRYIEWTCLVLRHVSKLRLRRLPNDWQRVPLSHHKRECMADAMETLGGFCNKDEADCLEFQAWLIKECDNFRTEHFDEMRQKLAAMAREGAKLYFDTWTGKDEDKMQTSWHHISKLLVAELSSRPQFSCASACCAGFCGSPLPESQTEENFLSCSNVDVAPRQLRCKEQPICEKRVTPDPRLVFRYINKLRLRRLLSPSAFQQASLEAFVQRFFTLEESVEARAGIACRR